MQKPEREQKPHLLGPNSQWRIWREFASRARTAAIACSEPVGSVLVCSALLGTVILGAGAGCDVAGLRSNSFTPYRLKPFVLPDLQQPKLKHASAAMAGRAMVLNFFYSSCAPCALEVPRLVAAAKQLPVQVQMLGIDSNEGEFPARAFAEKFGIPYPVALDELGAIAPTERVAGFPTTLFVDSSGVVVKRHLGAISDEELRSGINALAQKVQK